MGSIDLELEIAPGIEIDEVDYEITGNDITPITGVIPVDAFGSTISAHVGGIPEGEGYTVTLTATTIDGEIDCAGSAMFDVVADEASNVSVVMFCGDVDPFGSVVINGEVNLCPIISSFSVAPLQTSVGNQIQLAAAGTDADADEVEINWEATGGMIADPSSGDTTYTCQEVGTQTLTLTVTDVDADLGADECGDTQLITVECVAAASCDDVDCDDDNPCTVDSCVEEPEVACVNEPVEDGTECPVDGETGVCEAGECILPEFCVPGACDDDNECTVDICDEETDTCTNEPDEGASCTTDEGESGTCTAEGTCVAAPSPVTQAIPMVCANSFTPDLSQVPFELTVAPGPIEGGESFNAEVNVTAALTQEFLQSAAETVCGFGVLLDEVAVELLQSTVTAVSGASGSDVVTELTPVPQVVEVPIEEPTTCPGTPPTVTAPLEVPLSTETGTWTADASGEVLFGIAGMIPDSLTLDTPPTPTHLEVEVSVLGVAFACEPGILDDGGTPDDPADDTIIPLDDEDLISFPI
ncbi:MAG: hypothetical protein ACOC97_03210 [Myxococcota bacterium]